MPPPSPQTSITDVYSDQPVTRGLAILNNCRLKTQERAALDDMVQAEHAILIDWLPVTASAPAELDKLEMLVRDLLKQVQQAGLAMTLFDGQGRGWCFDRRARRRFWRRTSPLATLSASPVRP